MRTPGVKPKLAGGRKPGSSIREVGSNQIRLANLVTASQERRKKVNPSLSKGINGHSSARYSGKNR